MRRPRIVANLLAACLALSLVGAAGPVTGAASNLEGVLDGALEQALDGTLEGSAAADVVKDLVEVSVDDATGGLETVGCEAPLELVPGIGCARTTADGMVQHVTPDGAVSTTHGLDDSHTEVAGSSSGTLPSKRRPLLCTPDGGYRTVVVYAHLSGTSNRSSSYVSTIRSTMERSNQAVAESAKRSGGPLADLRVKCTSGGAIAVHVVRIPSRNFADVKSALASAGYNRASEKYLVFGDFDSPQSNMGGIADLFLDDRRSTSNWNNGARAMYGLVYGSRHFGGTIPLHELSHTMGAVQPNAPSADGYGHCTVNADVLCYPSSSTKCGSLVFDCGNDTYFSTKTKSGQWLHSRWNLGWEGNRFIRVATPSTASAGSAHALAGDWLGEGRDGIGWWRDGKVRLRTASGQVIEFGYGRAGDIPVVGDWNRDGKDSLAIVRDGTWHVKDTLGSGDADRSFTYGRVSRGDVPIAGDWNGDGRDGPGIIRDGAWHLRNTQSGGDAHVRFTYGRLTRGDLALVGDWLGNGMDVPGIVRTGAWHLRHSTSGGPGQLVYTYGRVTSGDVPVMGDWTGDGRATPGIVRGSTWHVKMEHGGGPADLQVTFAAP